MKKLFIIIFGLTLIHFLACDKEENTPDPTCSDGIQNGTELGIDCGGSCNECFVCETVNCSNLTGAMTTENSSSILWEATHLDGEEIACPCTEDIIIAFVNWQISFTTDGDFSEQSRFNGQLENFKGTWRFDDPESPEMIILTYKGDTPELKLELVSLKSNELKVVKVGYITTLKPKEYIG